MASAGPQYAGKPVQVHRGIWLRPVRSRHTAGSGQQSPVDRRAEEKEEEKRTAQVKSRDPHQTWWGKTATRKKKILVHARHICRNLYCLNHMSELYL